MIRDIYMKKCASYDANGITIENCDKVNFIYGHNGSGKSTISKFIANPKDEKYADCSIVETGVSDTEFLVYNKDFRDKNIQATDMPGVFTIGETTAEQLDKLKELEDNLKKREKEKGDYVDVLKSKQDEKNSVKEEYTEIAWKQVLKKNEELKEAFTGFRGTMATFLQKLREEYKLYKTPKYSREEIMLKATTLFGNKPEEMNKINAPDFSKLSMIEADDIWKSVIVGNTDVDIAGLISSLNMSDWVKAGQKYVKENDICPFCQKPTIDSNLREQFEKYFSGDFELKTQKVADNMEIYSNYSSALLVQLNDIFNMICASSVKLDTISFEINIKSFETLIKDNIALIETKKTEPSRVIKLASSSSITNEINTFIESYNQRVDEHNRLVLSFKEEKKDLINQVWKLVIFENKDMIDNYESKISNLDKVIENITEKIKVSGDLIETIKNDIIIENKNITSVQPTVDAINIALHTYGFNGFSIVASPENPNRYQIMRPNGIIATETLSEGEETFISFLYYVHMTKGGLSAESATKKKVLVIDDPICSLDSSILYVVSSLVRELMYKAKKGINNIEQIFVLTHNVYFHKEISFIEGKRKEEKKTKFWMLHKKDEITSCKAYEYENPITTTYALLWKEVKENENISNVSLQNAMRRILENFFGTIGNEKSENIFEHFETPEEKSICRSLFSWANDGSHMIADDFEFSENTDAPDKYRKIFKDIFYKTNNQYHYDAMMEQ